MALALWLRDAVVDIWFASTRRTYQEQRKRVYYLSMEFLIGRLIEDVAINLRLEEQAQAAIEGLGLDYRSIVGDEPDAALGNGGLGRLAACFLDSLSTLGDPGLWLRHPLRARAFPPELRGRPPDRDAGGLAAAAPCLGVRAARGRVHDRLRRSCRPRRRHLASRDDRAGRRLRYAGRRLGAAAGPTRCASGRRSRRAISTSSASIGASS